MEIISMDVKAFDALAGHVEAIERKAEALCRRLITTNAAHIVEVHDRRLIVPAFHGREHLNAARWMRALPKVPPRKEKTGGREEKG